MKTSRLLLLGLILVLANASGCRKTNEATQAVAESDTTEREGSGDETAAKVPEASEDDTQTEKPKLLGIFLPCSEGDPRWRQDESVIANTLTVAGYDIRYYYADGRSSLQAMQIRQMLGDQPDLIIIAPVDAYKLTEPLEQAKEAGVLALSYKQLIMDTDALKALIIFDKRAAGRTAAREILERAAVGELPEEGTEETTGEEKTIEFLLSEPADAGQLFFFNGMMEVLEPYLEAGVLVCRSGRTSYEAVCADLETNIPKRLKALLVDYYNVTDLPDILVTADAESAVALAETMTDLGIGSSLAQWPLITAVGADLELIEQIAADKVNFTMFMDDRELAAACANTAITYLNDEDPEVSNYGQYDNGVRLIRAVTCEAQVIDGDNYQLLADNGYFEKRELAFALEKQEPQDTLNR